MDFKKEFIEKINFSSLFKKKNALFLIGLAGIFLLFLSDLMAVPSTEQAEEINVQSADYSLLQAESYAKDLEVRLSELLKSIEGAGNSKIMITLETPIQMVYAKNTNNESETITNEDGSTNTQYSNQSEHLILNDANNDIPLIEMQLLPEIKGVAVICEGGDEITVVSRITELVSVVLGVPSNRICVTKMNLTKE